MQSTAWSIEGLERAGWGRKRPGWQIRIPGVKLPGRVAQRAVQLGTAVMAPVDAICAMGGQGVKIDPGDHDLLGGARLWRMVPPWSMIMLCPF